MVDSSESSVTMAEERLASNQPSFATKSAPPPTDKGNIIPGIAADPYRLDLEKSEQVESPASPGNDPSSFPDGGGQAWLAVSGSFACLFCSFGWINAIGVFQTEWEKNQLDEYPSSTIAWIVSVSQEL